MITVCLVFIREPTLYKKKLVGGFNLTLCHEDREIIRKATISTFLFSFGDIFDVKPKSTVVCLNRTLQQSFLWRKYGSLLLIYSLILVSQALSAAQYKLPESHYWYFYQTTNDSINMSDFPSKSTQVKLFLFINQLNSFKDPVKKHPPLTYLTIFS